MTECMSCRVYLVVKKFSIYKFIPLSYYDSYIVTPISILISPRKVNKPSQKEDLVLQLMLVCLDFHLQICPIP